MIRRSRSSSRSSQSSSVHPPPQPTDGPSETQGQPTPIEVGGIGSSSNANIGKKRTRGSNRGIKLFNRRPDDKLIVQFNAEGQPIGENARPFATLCGIIVRTPGNAPLQVTKWADVPEQAKEKMWKHIPIVVSKHLNIQGGLRVLLDTEMRRLGAGLMGVYLLERISSFVPIVERTGLLLMRNLRKSFQSLGN